MRLAMTRVEKHYHVEMSATARTCRQKGSVGVIVALEGGCIHGDNKVKVHHPGSCEETDLMDLF